MTTLRGLVIQEVRRLVSRRRFWLGWTAFAAVGVCWMQLNRDTVFALPSGRMAPTGPMLAIGAVDALGGLVLFTPLMLGGTLAEDRASGLDSLLLSRCRSRTVWVSSKVVACFLLSLIAYVGAESVLLLFAVAMEGWRSGPVAETVGTRVGLLASQPVSLLAVTGGVLALASAAMVAWSSAIGAVTRTPIVALVAPLTVAFGVTLAVPAPLSPYLRATFLGVFFEWNTLWSTVGYWGALALTGWMTACGLVASRRLS